MVIFHIVNGRKTVSNTAPNILAKLDLFQCSFANQCNCVVLPHNWIQTHQMHTLLVVLTARVGYRQQHVRLRGIVGIALKNTINYKFWSWIIYKLFFGKAILIFISWNFTLKLVLYKLIQKLYRFAPFYFRHSLQIWFLRGLSTNLMSKNKISMITMMDIKSIFHQIFNFSTNQWFSRFGYKNFKKYLILLH